MAIDGVSRELVEEAEAGSYVEPENPVEFNRIIRNYLANPAVLKEQGEKGYQYANQHFDRTSLAKKYLSLIQ